MKALEWDAHGRDRSFLLRGAELAAAEQWLALAAGKEPLAQALCKNILNGDGIENARRLAAYAEAVIAALAGLDEATLRSASWKFPSLA